MNKFFHGIFYKAISFILMAAFILSAPLLRLTATAAVANIPDDAVHISTVQDLIEFSKNCTSNSFSQNKVFVLEKDIDLSGTDFSPIPSFGGLFLGQGHTIRGLSLTDGSDYTGLFRYIQKDGEVCNLSVSGTATAESAHSGLALLAGCNYGVISNCRISGSIAGGNQTAGIAGLNEVTGIITDCTSNGAICGTHLTGGIAGSNKGSIINSYNHSFINTAATDNRIDLTTLDMDAAITDFLTTENAASVTDIGGIAGSNSGLIRACVNDGSIGYQHVGYNIGGIAGSQTGYIEGCVNYGLLNGRKDVGGIAGQMEPSSEMEYLEDTLHKLNTEFNKLHDLLTQLDRDASAASSNLTGQVDQLMDSVENAQHAVDEILINAATHVEEFSVLTDLTILPSPDPVSLDFLDDLSEISLPVPSFRPTVSGNGIVLPTAGPTATTSPGATAVPVPTATSVPGGSPLPTAAATPVPTATPVPAATPAPTATPVPAATPIPAATPAPTTAPSPAAPISNTGIDTNEGNGASGEENDNSRNIETSSLSDNRTLQKEYGTYTSRLLGAPAPSTPPEDNIDNDTDQDSGDDSSDDNKPSFDFSTVIPDYNTFPSVGWPSEWPDFSIDREKVERDINDVQQNIYQDASHVLESIQNTVQDQAAIVSSRIWAAQNSLSSSFSAIILDMRILNSMLDDENQILLNDIQAIIDELNVIGNIITDPQAGDPEDILTDDSDNDQITDTAGKVMNCINNGEINGDLNTGGIAGSLSRENNLDPENDFVWDKDNATLNFRYKERIVVRQCQNTGAVKGKRDRVGGIAGEMTLGSIIDCTNSGAVKSDGNMAGGIAGYSASTIRSSSAKCSLSGKKQVGGIAGYGAGISDCYSMITIKEGESFLGSIAGKTDSSGEITNNFFVEGCPAGIDGISYDGIAQPLSYEKFMESPNLPDMFQNIYLTFLADGKIVDKITLSYGETFYPQKLPSVPVKEGYVGKWEAFDQRSITCDQTIEAVYTEYVTTIESQQVKGVRPILLIEGTFTQDDKLTLTEIDAYPPNAQTRAECWEAVVSAPKGGPYTVRYLIPSDMVNPQIELYENNTWRPIDSEKDGSYYIFTSKQAEFIFCCVDRPVSKNAGVIAVIFVILSALLLLVISFCIRRKKKRKSKSVLK